ncbi:MAG: serine/threonine-protein phosphatase [Phycisphaeraceae bacterium]|nr:serine/threonine-protein phosphatase [Phycisphaeraceae bacterium]
MPAHASITSAHSLQVRLLRTDRWRGGILLFCYACIGIVLALRRLLDGPSNHLLFVWGVSVIAVAITIQIAGIMDSTRRLRRGEPLPEWRPAIGTLSDLIAPFLFLRILQEHSSHGPVAALSAPAVLIVPLVIMLSVMRLRPANSIAYGIVAAVAHAALAWHAGRVAGLPIQAMHSLYSYAVLLLLTGIAAGALATFSRRAIEEAVREAEAAERSGLALAAVQRELDIAREHPAGGCFPQSRRARPASTSRAWDAPPQAGGDYFDWQTMPDGRIIVSIADVTGHGIGPALVMAVCRAYARAMISQAPSSSELLDRLNQLIVADVRGARFITMAVAIISPDGDVELLSAGHGPTLHHSAATGALSRFDGDGLPLGIDESERYGSPRRFRLEPGDALVMLTDGFIERANPRRELFGFERLSQAITRHAALSASAMIDAIDRETAAFAQAEPQGDDMTAVIIKRR